MNLPIEACVFRGGYPELYKEIDLNEGVAVPLGGTMDANQGTATIFQSTASLAAAATEGFPSGILLSMTQTYELCSASEYINEA